MWHCSRSSSAVIGSWDVINELSLATNLPQLTLIISLELNGRTKSGCLKVVCVCSMCSVCVCVRACVCVRERERERERERDDHV